jgi:hypothetical protein
VRRSGLGDSGHGGFELGHELIGGGQAQHIRWHLRVDPIGDPMPSAGGEVAELGMGKHRSDRDPWDDPPSLSRWRTLVGDSTTMILAMGHGKRSAGAIDDYLHGIGVELSTR